MRSSVASMPVIHRPWTTMTDAAPSPPAAAPSGTRAQADVQVPQLLLADGGRRVGERTGGGLRLRERDDLADAVGARHQHDEPVEAESDAAVRRRPEPERLEQEAELRL